VGIESGLTQRARQEKFGILPGHSMISNLGLYASVRTLSYIQCRSAPAVKLQRMAASPTRKYSPRLPREERREQLLDAALRIIATQGFSGVSMEAVAREADIAKTVVYDAFGNKRELLGAVLEREQERVLSSIAAAMPALPLAGEPAQILADGLEAVLDAVHRHPDTWRLILLPADGTPPSVRAEVERHRDQLLRQMEPLVAWGAERLGFAHLDPELTAHLILGTAENAARLTLTQPRRFPPQRLASFTVDVLAAITPRKPARPR
jgi:AcrR family transcriptional regulator